MKKFVIWKGNLVVFRARGLILWI